MLYSEPTPPGGIVAEVVVADESGEITPERVAGRLVLTSGIGVELGLAALQAGAAGLVADHRGTVRHIKDGPYLDTTNEWHNFTIPPWDAPGKGFGFSITPAQGRRLRGRIAAGERVRLRAEVDTVHYDGVLPLISGLLPGRLPEEIALTGHFDEFGADDNCSQIAVILEAVRAVAAMVRDGSIPPLERTIRVLFPMEVRGFNALIQRKDEIQHIRAGLNVDTVGTDQNAVTASCSLTAPFAGCATFADELAAELLDRVRRDSPLFRWHEASAETIDNIFSEPLIGAPTPAIYHFSGTHHLALDTPDRISPHMLTDMARLTATYAAFLATAGLNEAALARGARRRPRRAAHPRPVAGQAAGRGRCRPTSRACRRGDGGREAPRKLRRMASGWIGRLPRTESLREQPVAAARREPIVRRRPIRRRGGSSSGPS
jgi:hypothetical protein